MSASLPDGLTVPQFESENPICVIFDCYITGIAHTGAIRVLEAALASNSRVP